MAVADASPIYLVAVVGVAVVLGTAAAVAAAFLSFLLYNSLFVEPRFTLTVADPAEWLNLLLLLFVAIVIGRLAALQSDRAADAARRARESQALFRMSRTLATAPNVADALPAILAGLAGETRLSRIWFGRQVGGRELTVADTGVGAPPSPRIHALLTRTPGDRRPAGSGRISRRTAKAIEPPNPETELFRVKIAADEDDAGLDLGDAVAPGRPARPRGNASARACGGPDRACARTRATRRGRRRAEVARQGDALKTRSSNWCRTTCARRSPASAPRRAA